MFSFITKKSYFAALDALANESLPQIPQKGGLKHIQDVCVLHHLLGLPAGHIAEIGGGLSRVLPVVSHAGWDCVIIDPFNGEDGGPGEQHLQYVPKNIRLVRSYMGDFSPELEANEFDATISISVLEHIPSHALENVFMDMFRITKSGGLSLHAIDCYVEDEENHETTQRLALYAESAQKAGFASPGEHAPLQAVFRCAYASNSDLEMHAWNKRVPSLTGLRERAQSVSVLLALAKP